MSHETDLLCRTKQVVMHVRRERPGTGTETGTGTGSGSSDDAGGVMGEDEVIVVCGVQDEELVLQHYEHAPGSTLLLKSAVEY